MHCDHCGSEFDPRHVTYDSRFLSTGRNPNRYGGDKIVPIALSPACARCRRGSVRFVFGVIVASLAAFLLLCGIFRLLH